MDGIATLMSNTEVDRIRAQADAYNFTLNSTRTSTNELGKDEFLKILITQLTNQDPTEPMQDRDFIAQMAQFSTLEQMTNMSSEFEKLGGMLQAGQAMSVLGKTVDLFVGDSVVTGRVDEITGGEYPQVLVNSVYYDYANVQRVRADEE